MSTPLPGDQLAALEYSLYRHLKSIQDAHALDELAVAFYDYETAILWSYNGDLSFHAASTMKLAVLLAIFRQVARDELSLSDVVHVRNRFRSIVDAKPFVLALGEQDADVKPFLGRTMTVEQLASPMIAASSNLATNLLVDAVGVETIGVALREQGIHGIEVRRGVEDQTAFERGLNNEVTASGLLQLLRLLEERSAYSPEASEKMLEILFRQQYRSGIPAGLPEAARVAHKTGNIRTVDHDAGIVYLEGRKPYVLVILTRFNDGADHAGAVAEISRGIYESLAGLTGV
jgi:beta-lactamase class A